MAAAWRPLTLAERTSGGWAARRREVAGEAVEAGAGVIDVRGEPEAVEGATSSAAVRGSSSLSGAAHTASIPISAGTDGVENAFVIGPRRRASCRSCGTKQPSRTTTTTTLFLLYVVVALPPRPPTQAVQAPLEQVEAGLCCYDPRHAKIVYMTAAVNMTSIFNGQCPFAATMVIDGESGKWTVAAWGPATDGTIRRTMLVLAGKMPLEFSTGTASDPPPWRPLLPPRRAAQPCREATKTVEHGKSASRPGSANVLSNGCGGLGRAAERRRKVVNIGATMMVGRSRGRQCQRWHGRRG